MTVELDQVIVGIFTAMGGGFLAALVNWIASKDNNDATAENIRAEATKVSTETTLTIIKGLREEVERLGTRVSHAETETGLARSRAEHAENELRLVRRGLGAYRRRVEYLTRLLEEAGITVDNWEPPDGLEIT